MTFKLQGEKERDEWRGSHQEERMEGGEWRVEGGKKIKEGDEKGDYAGQVAEDDCTLTWGNDELRDRVEPIAKGEL